MVCSSTSGSAAHNLHGLRQRLPADGANCAVWNISEDQSLYNDRTSRQARTWDRVMRRQTGPGVYRYQSQAKQTKQRAKEGIEGGINANLDPQQTSFECCANINRVYSYDLVSSSVSAQERLRIEDLLG